MVLSYVQDAFNKFVQYQASSGIILLLMTFVAIIFANSELSHTYHYILEMPVVIQIGDLLNIHHHFEHFVNDGLMVIFFLLVSLEIKREMIEGHLSSKDQMMLPILGALGGVLVPAAIYAFFNYGQVVAGEEAIRGWAIPTATDIAFAIGIISLFGTRVPISLKVFLTALAIIDDLAAILIIAVFYSTDLQIVNLLIVAAIMILMIVMNKKGVVMKSPYFFLGFIMWVVILESGIHATIAGVLIAATIPLRVKDENGNSPLRIAEHALERWVAFGILPIFAFCNAGVDLSHFNLNTLIHDPVAIGIIAGLFLGKQFGVFGTLFALVKVGIVKMPQNTNWAQIYGVSILTGIGFTMSIFVGNLAFPGNLEIINEARIGILVASFLSAAIGYLVIHITCPAKKK